MTFTPPTFTPIADGWTVEPIDGPVPSGLLDAPIDAQVPGVIHTDLLRAGCIADPFDGDNEAAQQWIGDTSWRYATTFEWHDDGSTRHDLVAFGLDTLATVMLNGTEVARTENQHRSYRWSVADLLIDGANHLVVEFAAPVPAVNARADRYGALPRVNHHPYNQLRKTASHFGWDWGIDVAGVGIWQPIGIDSWSGARVAAVRPLVDVADNGTGVLTAHVEIERDGAATATDAMVTVRASGNGANESVHTSIPATMTKGEATLRIADVARWWPIGHGDQPLYEVAASVVVNGQEAAPGWSGRVGFRTVRIDTAPDDAGRPFAVHVNGAAILIRGVNWIPDHAFLTEISRGRYARRLRDATDAHVNLIRVWGGGIYESDDFYELADELGLLVWQDFLFACAAYSEEAHLAAEVEAEAREQITRLSSHPSLIVWNGNNENIWGYADWGWPALLAGRTWGDGYYRQLFPALLAELDPTRAYSPASPYSFGEYLHPNDERNGTMHIWDVWNREDYRAYRDYAPRFVSEFGFQGPPAWSTLTRVVHDEPLDPYGHEMLVHQKASRGNEKLDRGLTGHLPAPTTIDDWHWATQLNQAHAIRFGVEHFRSLTPHNTGTILWQLNDNWPVVSWAAVDFDEHRKPLWYAMRTAYAPRLATIQPRSSEAARAAAFEGVAPELDVLALVLVNDTAEAWSGTITFRRMRVDGTALAVSTERAAVDARGVASLIIPDHLSRFIDPSREILVAEPDDGAATWAPAIWNPSEIADQALDPDPIEASVVRTEDGYAVTVTARSYARDLFLQVDRVDPTATVDQGLVTLLAGQSARFSVRSDGIEDPAMLTVPPVLQSANALRARTFA
ncbi:glycoside hydrolase family 2 protein [Curtobacterium ammoniigenes]|uniref:glycoside hydrolase family 2 protein n=1 Tax=Curtobacterium ammoniigenes TaxID=395387 RepID=UPI00082E6652|nr:beta-mannosidase [Curtobacterium ammoniigenes]